MYFCIKRKFYVLENPSVGKCYLKIWYDVMYLKLLSLYLCNCTEMHSDWKTTFAVCHFQITKQEEVEPKMTVWAKSAWDLYIEWFSSIEWLVIRAEATCDGDLIFFKMVTQFGVKWGPKIVIVEGLRGGIKKNSFFFGVFPKKKEGGSRRIQNFLIRKKSYF